MAFSKFKIDRTSQRATPVPIAAALPRTSSAQDNHVQHVFSEPYRNGNSLALGSVGTHQFEFSHSYQSGKRDFDNQNETTCLNSGSESLHNNQQMISMTRKDKRPRVMASARGYAGPERMISQVAAVDKDIQPAGMQHLEMFSAAQDGLGSPTRSPRLHESNTNTEKSLPGELSNRTDKSGIPHCNLKLSREERLDYMLDQSLSPDLAEQVFYQYIGKLAPTCPVVIFAPETTADYVRKSKPLLFLAILSVASAQFSNPDQHRKFALEARNFLAESAVVEGEKSLELVQALLVVTLWFRAPENYARANQNQLAYVALSIAIDIGLDRVEGPKATYDTTSSIDDKWGRAEKQRTWLGCFLLCASLSSIMRRPNPAIWTSQLDEYVNDLNNSRVSPTDDFLCKFLSTEQNCHIADKELSLSDPRRSVSLWEPETLRLIESIQSRADRISLDGQEPLQRSLVKFGKLVNSLYAHELALHVNHNIDEFKAPFSARSLESYSFIDMQASNTAYFNIVRVVILASHGLLDTFIGLSISDMLSLPPHIYAGRILYAIILLIKLHKALSVSFCASNEKFSVNQLRLESYIERFLDISKRLNAEDGRNSLSRAFLIMPQLKEWIDGHLSKLAVKSDSLAQKEKARDDYSANPAPATSKQHEPLHDIPEDGYRQAHAPTDFSGALGALTSQPGNLVRAADVSSREAISDLWFWEFFNVDMLQ